MILAIKQVLPFLFCKLKVSKLIKNKHNGDYLIINLSGRKYDYSKFQDKVESFFLAHLTLSLFILGVRL